MLKLPKLIKMCPPGENDWPNDWCEVVGPKKLLPSRVVLDSSLSTSPLELSISLGRLGSKNKSHNFDQKLLETPSLIAQKLLCMYSAYNFCVIFSINALCQVLDQCVPFLLTRYK